MGQRLVEGRRGVSEEIKEGRNGTQRRQDTNTGARTSSTLMRPFGSNTSIRSSSDSAAGAAVGKSEARGVLGRAGRDWIQARALALEMKCKAGSSWVPSTSRISFSWWM